MSLYDTQSLHDFLCSTPEGGLRKMLVDKKNITDVHFNLLMKIVRAGEAEQFGEMVEKKEFPRIRMSPAEMKLKEKFWDECFVVFKERGILQPAAPVKVAA
jgi:hypothetical protein